MRAVLAAIAVAIACAAAPASAQNSGGQFYAVSFGLGNARTAKTWELPVTFEGSVVVHFDSAFGSGRTVWSPGQTGQFSVVENKTRAGRRISGFLASTSGLAASARVERPGGVCTDTSSATFDQAAVKQGKDAIQVGLAGSTPGGAGFHMTETRCGGPLLDDLGRVLGMVRVGRAQLLKGGFDIDFRKPATPLSASGITGTVESTVIAHVGKRAKPGGGAVAAGQSVRLRILESLFRVASVSGTLTGDVQGGGDVCAELDSCDSTETISLAAGRPAGGGVALEVTAPVKRPLRDLRAGLGLGSAGRTKGLDAGGSGYWTSNATTISAALSRAGAAACQDTRHLAALALRLETVGKRIVATVQTASGQSGRTACPGPALGGGVEGADLASGSVPLRAFGRRRVTLHLTRGSALATDGWTGATRGSLTIVLQRTRVTTRTLRF